MASSQSEVTFLVGPEETEVKGKKAFLLTSVFKTLLKEAESTGQGKIKLPHLDPGTFRTFLLLLTKPELQAKGDDFNPMEFMRLRVSKKTEFDLYRMSKEFDVEGLKIFIESYFRQNISLRNILECFEIVQGTGENELDEDIFIVINRCIDMILKDKKFLSISKQLLLAILRHEVPPLSVSEVQLFQAVYSWGKAKALKDHKGYSGIDEVQKNKTLREILNECLSEIRFPLLSVSEFTNHVRSSGLLDETESQILYDYLSNEENRAKTGPTLKLSDKLTVKTTARSKPQK